MSTFVRNMTGRTGRPVANQFIITTDQGQFFQSYETVIAFYDNAGGIYLDAERWDYSTTTGKYRNQFLGIDKAETEKLIKSGRIKLADLNKRGGTGVARPVMTGEW